jgi:hypothetical protein
MEGGGVTCCARCGAPKPSGRGRKLCDDCREISTWRNKRKARARTVTHRLPCEKCGGVKEPGHGRRFCKACAAPPPRLCRNCDTEIKPPAQLCDPCRARSRERQRERDRIRCRDYRRRKRAEGHRFPRPEPDPEQRRMAYRLRAWTQGRQVSQVPERDYLVRYGNGSGGKAKGLLPAAPLRERVFKWLDPPDLIGEVTGMSTGMGGYHALALHTRTRLSELSGVHERRIYDLLSGSDRISLRNADRICVAIDVPLSLLYPEER